MSPTTTTTSTTTVTTASESSKPPTATTTIVSTAPSRSIPRSLRSKRLPASSGGGGISSVSTPNLSSLYASHARLSQQQQPPPPLPLLPVPSPLLLRKASLAALTSSSLATIPDDTEFYALDTLNEAPKVASPSPSSSLGMAPLTPGGGGRFGSSLGPGSSLPAGPDVAVGDVVDVPGGLTGVVRFVGSVAGRKGVFAGVELHAEFASRGKNNGDVDG